MQTHPYVFTRNNVAIAYLHANGTFKSNHDDTGWYEFDSLADFFEDNQMEMDPVNYIAQIATVVSGVPQLNMQEITALTAGSGAAAPAAAAAEPTLPAAPVKSKRGRRSAAAAGVAEPAPAPAPAPAPVQVVTPAPVAPVTVNPLQDPKVQQFLATQRQAMAAQGGATSAAPILAPTPTVAPTPVAALTPPANLSRVLQALTEEFGFPAIVTVYCAMFAARVELLHTLNMPESAARLEHVLITLRTLQTPE
jgi:hypothetical protein